MFVVQGGSLTIGGQGSTASSNSVGGGVGGNGAGSGQGFGKDIFIQGTNTISFSPGAGQTYTLVNDITDEAGSGGTLMDTGSVGDSQINTGGTLMPGNGTPGTSIFVNGNLVFQSGAIYLVQVSPSTASSAFVMGTAVLGGATVNAAFASGGYVARQYHHPDGGRRCVRTFAPTVAKSNLPSNVHDTLSYDADHVYLDLLLNFGIPRSLNGNQQAVGNALTGFFNTTGGIPMLYSTLSASQLAQASGESATGSQQTTFDAMSQFMGMLTDPFMNRTGGTAPAPGASGYADEDAGKKTGAFAMFTTRTAQSRRPSRRCSARASSSMVRRRPPIRRSPPRPPK